MVTKEMWVEYQRSFRRRQRAKGLHYIGLWVPKSVGPILHAAHRKLGNDGFAKLMKQACEEAA